MNTTIILFLSSFAMLQLVCNQIKECSFTKAVKLERQVPPQKGTRKAHTFPTQRYPEIRDSNHHLQKTKQLWPNCKGKHHIDREMDLLSTYWAYYQSSKLIDLDEKNENVCMCKRCMLTLYWANFFFLKFKIQSCSSICPTMMHCYY